MTTFLSPDALQDYDPYTLFIQPYREATDNWSNGISYYSGASIGMRVAHIVIGTLLYLPVINTIVLIALRLFNNCGRSYPSYVPQPSYGTSGSGGTSVSDRSPYQSFADLANQPQRSKFAMPQQPPASEHPSAPEQSAAKEEEEEDIVVHPPGGRTNLNEQDQRILNWVEESVTRHPNGGLCAFGATEYNKILEILKNRHPNLAFSYGDKTFRWKFLGPAIKA
jgi:hypothetical protein